MKLKTNTSYYNKRINFEYFIIEQYTAGIILNGWEVKCLDNHGGNITTSYCRLINNEMYLINTKISPTSDHYKDKITTTEITVDRKLLLNKSEIKKIKAHLEVKGLTCVPISLYRNDKNLWKINIVIVKPKKLYDKRQTIKNRDLSRIK